MTESLPSDASRKLPGRRARVLVFNVDEGLFAFHIDWVEAMYPAAAVEMQVTKSREGKPRGLVMHAGEPAAVVDLRDAFDLGGLLGRTVRADYLVVRTTAFLVALAVDACVGIRELDLEGSPPVPANLVRDGGFPVGHLTALDGKPIVVLDPNHLLEATEREDLASVVAKIKAFRRRETKIEALWENLRGNPREADLRTFARVAGRNGRQRASAAARLVLRHLEGTIEESRVPPGERLIREILCLWREKATGEVVVPRADGSGESRILLAEGRVVQTRHGDVAGAAAFRQLLATQPEHFYFVEADLDPGDATATESPVALIVGALDDGGEPEALGETA